MQQPVFIKVCAQRHDSDCALCCFVMLCGISYEAALVAIGHVDQKLATNGLYFTQIRRAAAQLGIKLQSLKKGTYDPQNSVGILGVRFKDKQEHAVLLFRGTIIDPDGGLVYDDLDAYIEAAKVKTIGSLLVAT